MNPYEFLPDDKYMTPSPSQIDILDRVFHKMPPVGRTVKIGFHSNPGGGVAWASAGSIVFGNALDGQGLIEVACHEYGHVFDKNLLTDADRGYLGACGNGDCNGPPVTNWMAFDKPWSQRPAENWAYEFQRHMTGEMEPDLYPETVVQRFIAFRAGVWIPRNGQANYEPI